MSKLEKLVSMVILVIATVVASSTGNGGYAPLFLLMVICIGSVPAVKEEEEVVAPSVVKRGSSAPASIAKKRMTQIIIESGSARGLLSASQLTLDDLFTLYIIHRDKFMAIETDLYKRALNTGTKDDEKKYLVAPLMRLGVIQKEAKFYEEVKLAF